MILKKIIKTVVTHLINIPGWRTNRKIVVIESDDWGSIRMPSIDIYNKCIGMGYRVDLNPYERYDSLASQEDLELLFEILSSFKDKNGNHPVITANCVVTNPDFDKIKKEHFRDYYYELITETFKRYPAHSKNFELWLAGKSKGVFYPQFHAREHLNVSKFMNALQKNDTGAHFGLENEMPGCIPKGSNGGGNSYVAATRYDSDDDKAGKLRIYLEGLEIFKKIFGVESYTIIPPNYIWSKDFNGPVAEMGVKCIQGIRKMYEPNPGKNPFYHSRRLGEINEYGQIALIRNCIFEPSLQPGKDTVDKCLSDISIAFRMKKPAIISSHRINYIGFIDPENRDKNLKSLKKTLAEVNKKWPEVEFMTSEALAKEIFATRKL